MASTTVRMDTESRKQQIVKAALESIGEYGIQGATISRIARGAGITPAALYSHFENRRAILVAALDAVYEQITDSFEASMSEDPVEVFRQICERHTRKVLSQDKTSHAHLFLEFVASAPEEGLREVLREKELDNNRYLIAIIRDAQERGRLPLDIDAEMVAWLVACWAWTGDVANLMDATSVWHSKVSGHLMQSILEALSSGRPGPGDGDGSPAGEAATEHRWTSPAQQMESTDIDGLPKGAVFTAEEIASILKAPPAVVGRMLEERQIASLRLGQELRVPRRALIAFLRGMSIEELDSLLERRITATRPTP